jgi:uncharacterized protein (TIGR03790 family)
VNRPSLLFLLLLPCVLRGQDSVTFDYRPATVVVYNSTDGASSELAKYYVKQRGIPEQNLVGLKCQNVEMITREEFQRDIEMPLRAVFAQRKWWETAKTPQAGTVAAKTTMRVITVMQGVPLRISHQAIPVDPKTGKEPVIPGQENASSVDAELAAFGLLDKAAQGYVVNPYFKANVAFAKTGLAPMFLVGRIDGPSKAIAKRLIDDAIAVEKEGLYGKAYVDLARKTQEGYAMGETWLVNCGRMLELNGIPTIMDMWEPTFPANYPMSDCALYLGWYNGNADGPFLNPSFRLRRGAVAVHIQSFSAATLKSDTLNWCGPLVAHGACATLGNVFEPFLGLCANLDIFTERLLAGYNLGEAAWMSTQALSWMNVVIGDPLYRPFGTPPGGGNKKVAADYKALRLAMQRWGKPGETGELMANLQKMAEELKSPVIYEFMALHAQAGDNKDWPAAEKWFNLESKVTTTVQGLIRIQFLMADAMRRDGDSKQAKKVLKSIADKYPAMPEAAAARALLQQLP